MAFGNYSVEASIFENGKIVKGLLTLFIDEYSFGSKRKNVDWENVICEKGTVAVKGFLRSIEKPCITFKANDSASPQFIMEQSQIDSVIDAVTSFAEIQKGIRLEKRARERDEAREDRILEVANQKPDKEYQQKYETGQQISSEGEGRESLPLERKRAEKQARIRREIEAIKDQATQGENMEICPLAKKAGSCFLNNPYRTLGVSCLASNKEANAALDRLKKLARLNALESFHSPYDLIGIEGPSRDLSVSQNALTLIKDKSNKWFWFAEPDSCIAWQSGKYRVELVRDGQEFGTYDLFLANYLYAVLCDSGFNTPETWKRVLVFYCFICEQDDFELLRSRYNEEELQDISNSKLLDNFQNTIFKPLLLLCERDDLDAVLRIHKCIKSCDNRLLDGLDGNVLSKLASWFTDKKNLLMRHLEDIDSEEYVSEDKGNDIRVCGEMYCQAVDPVLEMVLRDLRGDVVWHDMIRNSYHSATYQLMYRLNECGNKSDAIVFANRCYPYCNADDKKRILHTFGETNIKFADWNLPHTVWDIKGDEFYYGRGCAVDYSQALYWYHKAADAGNMYSQNSIGICYQKGHGVPQSDSQAVSWFERACKSGNPEGAYNLAECYFSGTGVEKNVDQALKYWAEAIKLGHPSARQRRDEVFSKIQSQRRSHRASNHVCHDLGFQMTGTLDLVAEVTLNQAAYVYLVNQRDYQNYLNGDEFSYHGGYVTESPFCIEIPSSNHWYIVVDNGEKSIAGLTSSAKVKKE